jgi:hypothetical protein
MNSRRKPSKPFLQAKSELTKLDVLCDIFSFYTTFDGSVSRQVCKWWNGLMTKDIIVINQIKKNSSKDSRMSMDSLECFPSLGKIPMPTYEDENKDLSEDKFNQAIYNNHFDLVIWNLKNKFLDPSMPREYGYTILSCILGNSLKLLKFFTKLYKTKDSLPYKTWEKFLGSDLDCGKGNLYYICNTWNLILFQLACAIGNLKILNYFKEDFILFLKSSRSSHYAALRGHLHVLEWLSSLPVEVQKFNYITTSFAALGGHRNIIEWLLLKGVRLDRSICSFVAESGNFELLVWLIEEKKCYVNAEAIFPNAIDSGNLDMVKWIYSKFKPNIYSYHAVCAANHGHIHILEWLFSPEIKCDSENVYQGALLKSKNGVSKIPTLDWASKNLYKVNDPEKITYRVWDHAFCNGDLEVFEWLKRSGMPPSDYLFQDAINSRDMKLIEWISVAYQDNLQSTLFVPKVEELVTFLNSLDYSAIKFEDVETEFLNQEFLIKEGLWMRKNLRNKDV